MSIQTRSSSTNPISVVVPIYNKMPVISAALASITAAAARLQGVEVILVDHCSADGSYEVAQQQQGAVVLRHEGGTIAAVRNVGAAAASGQYLSFLDSDVVVPTDYFMRLRAAFESTGAEAVGYECGIPEEAGWSERVWHSANARTREGPTHYINAANFAVRRHAFEAVGGFNEALVTGEDTDICGRLRDAGYRVLQIAALDVVHLDNPKSLTQFFRKEMWRGLGMSRGDPLREMDKPTAMSGLHLLLLAAAVLVMASGVWPLPGTIAVVLVLANAVPLSTVTYRSWELKRGFNVVLAAVLYHVYYLARGCALLLTLARRLSGREVRS